MMAKERRRKLFLDYELQKTMMIRVGVYWLAFVIAVFWFEVCRVLPTQKPGSVGELLQQVWSFGGPAIVASVLMLPALAIDCLRLTHRFAGPIYRLRRAMADLAQGRAVPPQKLREKDFLKEFAEDFNRVSEFVQQSRRQDEPTAQKPAVENQGAESVNHEEEEFDSDVYPALANRSYPQNAIHEVN